MPLKNTRVIPTGWSAHHRRAAAGGMNATCELRGPSTDSTYDPDSMSSTATPGPLLWTGAARVQALTGDAATNDQAGQQVTVRGYLVQLDESDPANQVPQVDPDRTTVEVTACVNDARLAGRSLTVTDVQYGSERFTRDLICQDNEG